VISKAAECSSRNSVASKSTGSTVLDLERCPTISRMECTAYNRWIESLRSICRGIVTLLTLIQAIFAGATQAQSLGDAFLHNQVFTAVQTRTRDCFRSPDACLSDTPQSGAAETSVDNRPLSSGSVRAAASSSVTNDASRENIKPAGIELNRTFKGDPNRDLYYKNRLELSLDGGWLPINIPFVFDVFLGDGYTMTSLRYTLVPIIASVRWQLDDVGGPWIFRGNWDLTASGAVTLIPRGPETHYYAWMMGVRRNFVPRQGRISPYFDGRLGLGEINAKEPLGVLYAQGQNFTFTVNMGSGFRYNFNPRYSISAGLNWMHISNLYLSEPKFANYGINVYGPMFGIDVRLGRLRHHASD
jgi:hypothetical protein